MLCLDARGSGMDTLICPMLHSSAFKHLSSWSYICSGFALGDFLGSPISVFCAGLSVCMNIIWLRRNFKLWRTDKMVLFWINEKLLNIFFLLVKICFNKIFYCCISNFAAVMYFFLWRQMSLVFFVRNRNIVVMDEQNLHFNFLSRVIIKVVCSGFSWRCHEGNTSEIFWLQGTKSFIIRVKRWKGNFWVFFPLNRSIFHEWLFWQIYGFQRYLLLATSITLKWWEASSFCYHSDKV